MTKVSFIVPCRNKEQHIRATAKSVLAQTHTPLEIVFSDQGSEDNTLGILEDLAASYDGPNTVRVLQCPDTEKRGMLGLNAHFNWLDTQIEGDLVVMCSADDLNHPERVAHTVKAFDEFNPSYINTGVVYRSPNDLDPPRYTNFPEQGTRWIGPAESIQYQIHSSGSSAWARDLFQKYGPLDGCEQQDMILPMMAFLERGIYFINLPLHTYISHASLENTGFGGQIAAAADERHKTQLVELNNFINSFNWGRIALRWQEQPEKFTALTQNVEVLNALMEKVVNSSIAWGAVRNNMIMTDIEPMKMRV
jgi:glycosyltransferase involved in cell wall biosynthesis